MNVLNNRTVVGIKEVNGRKLVSFNDGTSLEADLVLFGIGEEPNTEFVDNVLKNPKDNSLLVNKHLQATHDENIFAAGDNCSFPVEG